MTTECKTLQWTIYQKHYELLARSAQSTETCQSEHKESWEEIVNTLTFTDNNMISALDKYRPV